MNKKYYIIIAILVVLLVLIIGLIGAKNLKNTKKPNNTINNEENKTEKEIEPYTGRIRCEIEDQNNEIYETYFIENIEVEKDKVKTNETERKVKYKSEDTYKGFKENEEVLDPIYDDDNLTVKYTFYEKSDLPNEDVDVYIKNLTDNGYKCEKVIN